MMPWELRAHCSIVGVAKRCEGLGKLYQADFAILPYAVCRGFRA